MFIINRLKPTIVISLVLVLLTACGGGDDNNKVALPPSGDTVLDILNSSNVPGISIAIIKDFKIDKLKVYGVIDQDSQTAVTPETLFQAASISKTLTAMAGLKLVQDAKIGLDENINNVLTSWKLPDSKHTQNIKVSLGALLSHTAGTSVQGFIGYKQGQSIPTLLQILDGEAPANSNAVRVNQQPGEQYAYSGGGYCIVQQAIEDITAQPFADVLQESVLTPLEMFNSSFKLPSSASVQKLAAYGHNGNGSVMQGKYNIYPELAPAGLWTTAEDLAKLLIELQLSLKNESNLVLNQEMMNTMVKPVKENNYGTGLELFDGNRFGHTGHNIGYYSFMIGHLTEGTGVVLLTNGEDAGDNNFLQRIFATISDQEF